MKVRRQFSSYLQQRCWEWDLSYLTSNRRAALNVGRGSPSSASMIPTIASKFDSMEESPDLEFSLHVIMAGKHKSSHHQHSFPLLVIFYSSSADYFTRRATLGVLRSFSNTKLPCT